jgi:putative membrane protein
MTYVVAHRRFAKILLGIYLGIWLVLAWDPWFRDAWLLENVLPVVLVPWLIVSHGRLPLSKISYASLFVFLVLHAIGSHYTYSLVPYDDWWRTLFGYELGPSLGWERNHYDRFVHLLYGVLIVYPVREVFLRVADAKGFWGYLFPVLVVMSSSLFFELLEWAAVLVFASDLGMAYLGTQGDIWDGHKDSALAMFGALGATLIIGAVHKCLDRDFSREWNASLRIKHAEPLGEVAIDKLLHPRPPSGGSGP